MEQKWYVYRFGIEKPILEKNETVLTLVEPAAEESSWRACFTPGKGKPEVSVEVVPDLGTDAWLGTWSGAGEILQIRWSRIGTGAGSVLAGQIFDRNNPNERRDFFVASQTQRKLTLPEQPTYRFTTCRTTPYNRTKLSENWGGLVVDRDAGKITFRGLTYDVEEKEECGQGLELRSWHDRGGLTPTSVDLWLLPVDATGRLLATGCFGHWPPGYPVRPFDPDCAFGLHGF